MSSSQNYERQIKSLHPLEKKVLPYLEKGDLLSIVNESGLKDVEVMRALQWLENKDILTQSEEIKEFISLDDNGFKYKEIGLPELNFLRAIKDTDSDNVFSADDVVKNSSLEKDELNICIGQLRKKSAIEIIKNGGLQFFITDNGKKLISKNSLEEDFLKKEFPLPMGDLAPKDKFAFDELLKRKKIVKKDVKKNRIISLTKNGTDLLSALKELKLDLTKEDIGKITPEMLKSGEWKDQEFRPYDISASTPRIYPGKRHFVNQAIDEIKKIWTDMGFQEMLSDHSHTAFWDMDALFVPQDHPAREMQDTFYIEDPKKGHLPAKFKDAVKAAHENGGETGSLGWRYDFSEDISKSLLLRTHTTVSSIMKIAELKPEDLPIKLFSVDKVYRNEALDWKHLFEFHQVEGIVIDPKANFKHLKGYLIEFYKKMGFTKVRMRPAHFPYTEPSAEVEVFDPKRNQWLELGGCGIFRPEVVKPIFGIDVPVLAWGNGMERIIKEYYKVSDIRDLYNNDLKKIREMKQWIK